MLSVYLFVIFFVVFHYLFTPDRTAAIPTPASEAIVPVEAVTLSTLPDPEPTPEPEAIVPALATADDMAGDMEIEPAAPQVTTPDLTTMTTRQLHQLARDLRDQGITIKRYKALPLPELRRTIAAALA